MLPVFFFSFLFFLLWFVVVCVCAVSQKLVAFIRKFRKELENLAPGDFMLVPGGWTIRSTHNVMFVLERKEDCFRFVVCNTGKKAVGKRGRGRGGNHICKKKMVIRM